MQDYLKLAKDMIKANKPLSVIEGALDKHYKQEHKKVFDAAQREEYGALFPETVTSESCLDDYHASNHGEEEYCPTCGYKTITHEIAVDYTDNPDYLTFEAWRDATIVLVPAELSLEGEVVTVAQTALVRPYKEPLQEDINTQVQNYLVTSGYTKELTVKEKNKALQALQVSVNTVFYDADGKAIGNMTAVVALANWKYIQLSSVEFPLSAQENYKATHKDFKVSWKGATNVIHTVMVESICEALEKAMNGVATIVVGE